MSKYSNNELHEHKVADTIKWIVVFVLLFAIIGTVICLGLQISGVFDKQNKAPTDSAAENLQQQGALNFSFQDSNPDMVPVDGIRGISLAYAYAASEPGDPFTKTLTATVLPIDAPDKTVDWNVAWQPDAEKVDEPVTNYVTVTAQSDGALTATVKCIKAFGNDKIVVSVVTRIGRFTASCTCSYVGPVQTITVNTSGLQPALDTAWNVSMLSLDCNKTYDFDINLDNSLHSVGAETELEIEVEFFGTALINNESHPSGGIVSNKEEQATVSAVNSGYGFQTGNDFFYLFKKLTVSGGKLHIECGDSITAINNTVGSRVGWNLRTFKGYKDNKPLYASIKVKDNSSGISSAPICIKVISVVSSVGLDNVSLTF